METLKIIAGCIVAAMLYGIVHDQVTARIYLPYFTVFHPHVFDTESPTFIAIGWGIIATWWVGAFLGVLLALSARLGHRAKLTFRELLPLVLRLLFIMAACALAAGILGYFLGRLPDGFRGMIPPGDERRFLADWWAHNASYASGIVGGIALCIVTYRKRVRLSSAGLQQSG